MLLMLFCRGCNATTWDTTTFAPIEYDEAFRLGRMVKFRVSGAYMAHNSGTLMKLVLTKITIIFVRPFEFSDLELRDDCRRYE
jgi:hypothetical protein